MLKVGQAEIDAIAKVIRSGKLFRHSQRGQAARFERRFARFLGVQQVHLTTSGTSALAAAVAGLGIGPGDEVIVPAHTWIATPLAVLLAGAIPVIVDVDESLTIDPQALDDAIGPRTRAVIPVHMWGLPCDMRAVMRIARRRKIKVIEDACQAAGGGYEGKMLGAIGDAGAFSFNFYKNITCGEGGAFVTRRDDIKPVIPDGARASEIEGAMLNVQLDRIRGLIATCRRQKKLILKAAAKANLTPAPCHSVDHECGTTVAFTFKTRDEAADFAKRSKGTLAANTGRHNYNQWTEILEKRPSHHPALSPFKLPQNRRCRMNYSPDMLPRTLDIINRTVTLGVHPDRSAASVIRRINDAARARS